MWAGKAQLLQLNEGSKQPAVYMTATRGTAPASVEWLCASPCACSAGSCVGAGKPDGVCCAAYMPTLSSDPQMQL